VVEDGSNTDESVHVGLEFDSSNFGVQFFNCAIIFIIILQNDIFNSVGYKKFVGDRSASAAPKSGDSSHGLDRLV